MKKIIGYIIILALLAGSICGITYGVKYAVLSNQTDPEYTNELENKVSDYQEQMNTYYLTILDLQSQINELKLQGTTDSATISSLETTITSLNSTIDSLTATNTSNETTIAENEETIASLKVEIFQLESDNSDKESEINSLNAQIAELEEENAQLEEDLDVNATTIAENNATITELKAEIASLESQLTDKANEIIVLNNTISSLETQNASLQMTNDSNLTLITSLNSQIVTLNEQIATLTSQITGNNGTVTKLNTEIAKLQQTISYYETYIASLETDDQAAVTFMFNGSVYSIQIVTKGTTASIADPTSTAYVVFNGWTVDGQAVTLDEYTITETTVFTADITTYYDVTFVSNSTTISTQIVEENTTATLPTAPTLTGYEFDGWSLDGVNVIEVSEYEITGTTTFTAKFTALHTVSFLYEDSEIDSQTIRDGEYASAPTVESTEYKTFNGWLLNGETVDVSIYSIVADTVFVADITYSYDVTFIANGEAYDTQIVVSGSYATTPTSPTISGYDFDGWTVNGTNLVDVSTYTITYDITFTAVYTAVYTVTFVYEDETISTQTIRDGEYATSPGVASTAYKTFNGWLLNGETVDVSIYSIVADTVFVADITYTVEYFEDNASLTSVLAVKLDVEESEIVSKALSFDYDVYYVSVVVDNENFVYSVNFSDDISLDYSISEMIKSLDNATVYSFTLIDSSEIIGYGITSKKYTTVMENYSATYVYSCFDYTQTSEYYLPFALLFVDDSYNITYVIFAEAVVSAFESSNDMMAYLMSGTRSSNYFKSYYEISLISD